MNDRQKEVVRKLGMSEADFEANKSMAQRMAELEEKVETLTSYVNAIGKTELVGDGSAEQPFELVEGMELIPNAYYNYNGTRYVYMGTASAYDGSELTFENGWTEF